MADGAANLTRAQLLAQAAELPLEEFNPADPDLFRNDAIWPYFERLRKEAPVHFTPPEISRRSFGEGRVGGEDDPGIGGYWSITRYADIMAVDTNHQAFSSDAFKGGITLRNFDEDFVLPMFIAMDPPKHDVQRKTVSPIVAPDYLASLESVIRERAAGLLDAVPRSEPFDWVKAISIELTTQMLATLFDFPWEDRAKLTRWSDVATAIPGAGIVDTEEQRRAELLECLGYFTNLWNERVNAPPKHDLISMLAHGPSTRNMEPMEYLGNIILLIVGGNDTTRNSITGGLYALNKYPAEYEKLRRNPALIPNMVSEIIRWQTPLAYMRRTCVQDTEIGGQMIREGDKVAMWYISGNRDPDMFENAHDLVIDRPNARRHMAFGFGIHRCVGNRLAEMQLRIVWEEILKRWSNVEVLEEPRRVYSSFVKGYEYMPVRIVA
ncbi:MAG: cytochrome P450 [Hyphomonadaceae bacterium]|nr:cytochrome P450 [Hyphomonadaceae bacterium]